MNSQNILELPSAINYIKDLEYVRTSDWRVCPDPLQSDTISFLSTTGQGIYILSSSETVEYNDTVSKLLKTLPTLNESDIYNIAAYPYIITLDNFGI